MLLGDATQMLFRCEMLLGDPDALCHESLEMLLGDATQMPFGVRCSWEIQMLFGMRCFVLHGGNYQLHSFGDALGRCSSDSTAETLFGARCSWEIQMLFGDASDALGRCCSSDALRCGSLLGDPSLWRCFSFTLK